jgi:dUTP pyrophosphatase
MPINRGELIRLYFVDEVLVRDIAAHLGCSQENVRRMRAHLELPPRDRPWSVAERGNAGARVRTLPGANLEQDMRTLAFSLRRRTSDVRREVGPEWLRVWAPQALDQPGLNSVAGSWEPRVQIEVLDGIVPSAATPGSAGLDLRSSHDGELKAGEVGLFRTGLRIAIPPGFVGLICPRSGLALKSGITVLNAPGILDSDYRGEVGVVMWNSGSIQNVYNVIANDRIAQLVIVPSPSLPIDVVEKLDGEGERGEGGFGSTGKQ